MEDGKTRRDIVHESGSLRVRCPGAPSSELQAVIVNTAGGIGGGDVFEFDFSVRPVARLIVTSAAAEKVYRALDAPGTIDLSVRVAAGGELTWLPHETILFDGAGLKRRIDVDVEPGGKLLMAEMLVFGRTAMGEVMHSGRLLDAWRVRHDGRLVLAETTRLEGDIAARLAAPAAGAGAVAFANVIAVPGDEALLAPLRELADNFAGEVAMSAWNGIAVVRLLAGDAASLRGDLGRVAAALRSAKLPRLWLN
jgi:urease accessory protein